jgi:hypothetical protein
VLLLVSIAFLRLPILAIFAIVLTSPGCRICCFPLA